jgi:hypothetical protein
MSSTMFETFAIPEILKFFSNAGLDYRYFVSYYRSNDKVKVQKNGVSVETKNDTDFIIVESGVLYPI